MLYSKAAAEVAPAANGLDAGGVHVAGGQFEMAPVVAANPPGSTTALGNGQPTVAYSSCAGKEEGSAPPQTHEEVTLL